MMGEVDPYLVPATSSDSRRRRALWNLAWAFCFRPSLRPMHNWRGALLRMFGATIGANPRIYPTAKIWAPWLLECESLVAIGPEAEIYNAAPLRIRTHAIVSQGAYVIGATHDYNDPAFPRIDKPSEIGAYSWICARAIVMPGVNVGEGSVLGAGSVATRDLEPWGVYAGNPARKVKDRKPFDVTKFK